MRKNESFAKARLLFFSAPEKDRMYIEAICAHRRR
jgi:hypothetical protein